MMQGPFDQQKAVMAQRMQQSTGAPAGGLQAPMGSPPPQTGGQQPPGGAPNPMMNAGMGQQPSAAKPLLDQVFTIIVRGNPADLDALGEFLGKIQSLSERHNMGQGQMQMGNAPPATPIP